MDTFPFTRKKFISLGGHTRHHHIIDWLGTIYQKLLTSRMETASLDLVHENYTRVMGWMEMHYEPKPRSLDTRTWLEWVSDAIQFHRTECGLTPKDHDLLDPVTSADRPPANFCRPCFDYHIALDGLRSLFNVGSVIRICDAAGFQSVILGRTPDGAHPGVQKTAMGAHKWVAQETTRDLASLLMSKKKEDYPVIGVETISSSRSFSDIIWPIKGIVVFGNEEYGISTPVRNVCDTFVHIPMFGHKNSLNVACAVSAVAFRITATLSPPLVPGEK